MNFSGGALAHSYAPQIIAFVKSEVTIRLVASVVLGIISHWLYDLLKGRKSIRAGCGAQRYAMQRTRGASPSTPVHQLTRKPRKL